MINIIAKIGGFWDSKTLLRKFCYFSFFQLSRSQFLFVREFGSTKEQRTSAKIKQFQFENLSISDFSYLFSSCAEPVQFEIQLRLALKRFFVSLESRNNKIGFAQALKFKLNNNRISSRWKNLSWRNNFFSEILNKYSRLQHQLVILF